jgi:putative ABC transport system permease protein
VENERIWVVKPAQIYHMFKTLVIAVIELTREIGMLRAIEATQAQVCRMVLTEALILAAIGTAFCLRADLYLRYILIGAMIAGGFAMPYEFPITSLLVVIAVGLLYGVLVAILPARQAAKLEIMEARRFE